MDFLGYLFSALRVAGVAARTVKPHVAVSLKLLEETKREKAGSTFAAEKNMTEFSVSGFNSLIFCAQKRPGRLDGLLVA